MRIGMSWPRLSLAVAVFSLALIASLSAANALVGESVGGGASLSGLDSGAPVADVVFSDARDAATARGDQLQQNAFLDGAITVDEYVAATRRMISCAEGSGLEIDFLAKEWSGLAFSYGFRADLPSNDVELVLDTCYEQHLVGIDSVYQMGIDLLRRERALDIAACLTNSGVPEEQLGLGEGQDPIVGQLVYEADRARPGLWADCVGEVVASRAPALPDPSTLRPTDG